MSVDNSRPQVFIEYRDSWTTPLLDLIEKYYARDKINRTTRREAGKST